MTLEEELALEGWIKKGTFSEPRLSEIVETYKGLDLEVRLEPFNPAREPECAECMNRNPDSYRTVYTRMGR